MGPKILLLCHRFPNNIICNIEMVRQKGTFSMHIALKSHCFNSLILPRFPSKTDCSSFLPSVNDYSTGGQRISSIFPATIPTHYYFCCYTTVAGWAADSVDVNSKYDQTSEKKLFKQVKRMKYQKWSEWLPFFDEKVKACVYQRPGVQ